MAEEDTPGIPIPPLYGHCPICTMEVIPFCKFTNRPKAPEIGAGNDSRLRCCNCNAVIEYRGSGIWEFYAWGNFTAIMEEKNGS